jgi:hypothetical protein
VRPLPPHPAAVGTVNKVATDFIGLLVLGFINAQIGAGEVRGEFKLAQQSMEWVSSRNPLAKIGVGCEVAFRLLA